jgi:hypothetical protein
MVLGALFVLVKPLMRNNQLDALTQLPVMLTVAQSGAAMAIRVWVGEGIAVISNAVPTIFTKVGEGKTVFVGLGVGGEMVLVGGTGAPPRATVVGVRVEVGVLVLGGTLPVAAAG